MGSNETLNGDWTTQITAHMTWLAAAGTSPHTLRLRRHYLRRLAAFGENDPWELDTDDLAGFLAQPGWAAETRRSARAAVRGFYTWAQLTGRLERNPARDLPAVRVPAGLPRPTPEEVVAQALRRADGRGRLMVLLAAFAGLRRGEIAALHSEDIRGGQVRVRGKGGKVRIVPLHPVLVAELELAASGGFLFPGRINGHLSPDRVGHILADLLGRGWTGHTLRHRFATRAYATQRDLLAVQQLLGHAKPETTRRYTALPDDALRAAVDGLPPLAA